MSALSIAPYTRFRRPSRSTATEPVERQGQSRDMVRLLVAGRDGVDDTVFRDLPDHLNAGDLVVVNNSATVNAQTDALLVPSSTGSARPVVLHVATPLDDGTWVVELRSAPDATRAVLDARGGDHVETGRLVLALREPYPFHSSPTGDGNRLWRAEVDGDLAAHLATAGRPISYGYLDAAFPLADYQTVFSTVPGSAEMPSAGRPFTADLVTRLVARGVGFAPITLHTGVSSQEAGEGPQAERFEVTQPTARAVNATRAAGGRVVAVGTTVTRALESAADSGGRVEAAVGWTERLITPADPPRVVDGLITGWHDQEASHLLLVEAVAGPALTQAAYDAAVAGGYRWHEFGDSALLLP